MSSYTLALIAYSTVSLLFLASCNTSESPKKDPESSQHKQEITEEDKAKAHASLLASVPQRLEKAKAVNRKKNATLEELADAKVGLLVPKDAPQFKEAERLYAILDARMLQVIKSQMKAKEKEERRNEVYSSPTFFERPGLHRTHTGRIYNVDIKRSGSLTIYQYTGAISGQVIVDERGRVTHDSREHD